MSDQGCKTLLLQSGLRAEAEALRACAERQGWAVVRRPVLEAGLCADHLSYYGDTFNGPRLVSRGRFVLLEPHLDALVRIASCWVRRSIDFGPLVDLVDRHGDGFFKPADPCSKRFEARLYDRHEAHRLAAGRHGGLAALHSEPVKWRAEFRGVIHRRALLSVVCYAAGGVRGAGRLAEIGSPLHLTAEARDFLAAVLAAPEAEFPPGFVLDVGLTEDRGWAVVELNPLWCARFFGATCAPYLDALGDVIWLRESIPAGLARWSMRSAEISSPSC